MMRPIQVSTDVFAKIWGLRIEGENTEDAVLCRVLGVEREEIPNLDALETEPVETIEKGAVFPEGFDIHRVFKGKPITAVAAHGGWLLDGDNTFYSSLNQLSKIGLKTHENAWNGWMFTDPAGAQKKLTEMRDQSAISSRGGSYLMTPSGLERLVKQLSNPKTKKSSDES